MNATVKKKYNIQREVQVIKNSYDMQVRTLVSFTTNYGINFTTIFHRTTMLLRRIYKLQHYFISDDAEIQGGKQYFMSHC